VHDTKASSLRLALLNLIHFKTMKNNVVDITGILAIKEIQSILSLSREDAIDFYVQLSGGRTLAEALRKIGFHSASQIGLERWPNLREWRSRHFPNNVKYSDSITNPNPADKIK